MKTIITITLLMLLLTTTVLAASSENDEQALAYGTEQPNGTEPQQFDQNPIVILILIGAIFLWRQNKKLYK